MALLGNEKNSVSKKVTFDYTHTYYYYSTIGDVSDLNSNACHVDYKSGYS